MEEDIIVAISTPPGRGGIGVVRVSGAGSLTIAQKLCPGRTRWVERMAQTCSVADAEGRPLDDAVVTYFKGPRSYTGEDVVELSCHGSPLVLDRVVRAALTLGCRAARPGEFTLRAFLSGRIDLTQAEAVVDLVNARTDAGAGLALLGLEGTLSKPVETLRSSLLDLLAHATALVDFSEEDIPALQVEDIVAHMEESREALASLLSGAHQGQVLTHGVSLAIVGSPNVGKSSLLNGLLRRDRAIVTDIPGTTRDTLEEDLDLGGVPFRVIDTAGMTATSDPVEAIGISRSRLALESAGMALVVLDGSRQLEAADREILELAAGAVPAEALLVAINKNDLPQALSPSDLGSAVPAAQVISTSAVAPDGLDELRRRLPEAALAGPAPDGFVVSNARHIQSLDIARDALSRGIENLRAGLPLDIVSLDLRTAAEALGSILGIDIGDEVLDRVFSRFCIGK